MIRHLSSLHVPSAKGGQAATDYLLALAVLALALGVALSSEGLKRSLSVLYTDMATRVVAPGGIDSQAVHHQALDLWGQ